MGLADLHTHTLCSYGATGSVSAVLKYAAHHTPLNVIAITNHDQIDGALQALDLAPSYGIEVIPGIEVSTLDGHVLALFVSQVIPAGHSIEETVLRARELGGLCIIPHPASRGKMNVHPGAIRQALRHPEVAGGLVGVEIFNAGLVGAQRDPCAIKACWRMPLARVGCSDAGWASWNAAPSEPLRLAWSRRHTTIAKRPPPSSGAAHVSTAGGRSSGAAPRRSPGALLRGPAAPGAKGDTPRSAPLPPLRRSAQR